MKILSYDSKVSQVLLRFCNGCWLGLLWLLCSLPLFTMGAATTALYAVTLSMARGMEPRITATFFRALKANFQQATVIHLILSAAGAAIALDLYILYYLTHSAHGALAVAWTLLMALLIALAVAWVMTVCWVYPLLARVDNSTRRTIKNAFLIAAHYLFATILVLAIHAAIYFVVIRLFTPLFLFAEGLIATLASLCLSPVIEACTRTPDQP